MPLVSHGLLKERCSFLDAQRYGACVLNLTKSGSGSDAINKVAVAHLCSSAKIAKQSAQKLESWCTLLKA